MLVSVDSKMQAEKSQIKSGSESLYNSGETQFNDEIPTIPILLSKMNSKVDEEKFDLELLNYPRLNRHNTSYFSLGQDYEIPNLSRKISYQTNMWVDPNCDVNIFNPQNEKEQIIISENYGINIEVGVEKKALKVQKKIRKERPSTPGSNKNTAKSLAGHFNNFISNILSKTRDAKILKVKSNSFVKEFLKKKIRSKQELLDCISHESLINFAAEFFGKCLWLKGVTASNRSSVNTIEVCFFESQQYSKFIQATILKKQFSS